MFRYFSDSNRPKVKTQKTGSKLEPIYKERVDKDGNKVLKKVGETNVFERAQADKDLCDINKTMERYGITTADSVRQLMSQHDVEYIDEEFFEMTPMDHQNKMLELEEQFNALDANVKSYFGNNFRKFYASVSNKTILDDLNKIDPETYNFVKTQKNAQLPVNNGVIDGQIPIGGEDNAK